MNMITDLEIEELFNKHRNRTSAHLKSLTIDRFKLAIRDYENSQLEPLAKPIIVDRKMVAHIANGVISLQKTDYIEDGAIIEINGGKIKLYEIPLYGGCPQLIGEYKTIIEAIAKSDELT